MEQKTIRTNWFPGKKLLVTEISGDITIDDVIKWEKTLHLKLNEIENNEVFKIFVNLFGFKAENFDAHKRFRSIIPLTLAAYGWRVGYVGLFPESNKELKLANFRGVQCIAAAHCHQDATKMDLYQREFGRENERYFTNVDEAENWISSVNTSS